MAAPTVLTLAEERLLHAVDDTNEAPWMVTPEYQTLMAHFLADSLRLYASRQRLPWYVITELGVVTPRPGSTGTVTLGPDLLVAHAQPQTEPRESWNVREEGRPPELVLEIVTDRSVERDTDKKRDYYDAMGVGEYVICWPRREQGLRLFGYHRTVSGAWAFWEPDARGVLWSSVLGGLGLYLAGRYDLRACNASGRRLPSPEEEAERADEATAAQQAAEERVQREVTARWAEAAARVEAEQRAQREAAALQVEARARMAAEERADRAETELERLRRERGERE
jgi:Uma2 family endonuclease